MALSTKEDILTQRGTKASMISEVVLSMEVLPVTKEKLPPTTIAHRNGLTVTAGEAEGIKEC